MSGSMDSSLRHTLYYATNRRHVGRCCLRPRRYSGEFSKDGAENLRFGKVTLKLDRDRVDRLLAQKKGHARGDGEALSKHVKRKRGQASIEVFKEELDPKQSNGEADQTLGSLIMFEELLQGPMADRDVLVFVHGFNVGWWDAVASATSLELMLNRNSERKVVVVLFTWPSDGRAIPFRSYFSDRSDARCSGYAVGRGFLKLRDYLVDRHKRNQPRCERSIHLLCHSMGNFVLQNGLSRTLEFSARGRPPYLFDEMFLCAPDVSDDVFEPGQPFRELPRLAGNVTVYYNRGDIAMPVSDHTKGNDDRLGWRGPMRTSELPDRVHSVDCSEVVGGLVEHGYHQSGLVNVDIGQSLSGIAPESPLRNRSPVPNGRQSVWRLERPKDAEA